MRKTPWKLEAKERTPKSLWNYGGDDDKERREGLEPRSVLENRTSPSTGSSSTFGVADLSGNPGAGRKDEWEQLVMGLQQPIVPTALDKCGLGVEEWDSLLCRGTASVVGSEIPPFLGCTVEDSDELSSVVVPPPELEFGGIDLYWGFPQKFSESESVASGGVFPPPSQQLSSHNEDGGNNPISASALPFSIMPQGMLYQENMYRQDQPLFFSSSGYHHLLPLLSQQTNHSTAHQTVSFSDSGQRFFTGHHQNRNQQQQALFDQLLRAAEFVQLGNSGNACEILARLNHLLSLDGNPALRSAFYLKESLSSLLLAEGDGSIIKRRPMTTATSSIDVILKISAYKDFSELSPILQFTNFTCIQTILEEFNGCDHIHIVDLDTGVGGHWASFLLELSQRSTTTTVRITAVVSSASDSHNKRRGEGDPSIELILARDTLTHLAGRLKIPFEFNIMSIGAFNPAALLEPGTSIAVNVPMSLTYTSPPIFLHLVNQLSPKIVVSVDTNCDRSNLSFSQNFLHTLHSCTALLESLEAAGANRDVSMKIERLIVQPRIEDAIVTTHRRRHEEAVTPWRTLFSLSGFAPVAFSKFTEAQAECVLKRFPTTETRGFRVERRQSSLVLFWERSELASVSAWRCC